MPIHSSDIPLPIDPAIKRFLGKTRREFEASGEGIRYCSFIPSASALAHLKAEKALLCPAYCCVCQKPAQIRLPLGRTRRFLWYFRTAASQIPMLVPHCVQPEGARIPSAKSKRRIHRALAGAEPVIGRRATLKVVGLTEGRLRAWNAGHSLSGGKSRFFEREPADTSPHDQKLYQCCEDGDALIELPDAGPQRDHIRVFTIKADDLHDAAAEPRPTCRLWYREFRKEIRITCLDDGLSQAMIVRATAGPGHLEL